MDVTVYAVITQQMRHADFSGYHNDMDVHVMIYKMSIRRCS